MTRPLPSVTRFSSEAGWRLTIAVAAGGLGLLAGKDPRIALGAIAALVFAGLAASQYTVAVGIFIVTTFLALPGTVAKGAGAVLVLAWFAMIATRAGFRDFAQAHKGMTALLLAFLAWTLLSVSWAESTSAVLGAVGRYLPNFFVFFVIYAAADKRSNALMLLSFFALGAAVAATDGVLNPPATLSSDISRAGGTFGDPNYLAMVLVVGLALSAALASLRSLHPLSRAGAITAAGVCVVGILLSVSRGGLVALAVALVAGVLIARRWRIPLATLTVLVTIVTVGYFGLFASAAVRQRVTQANGGSGRADIWLVGWRMVQAHPVNGIGAGNFPVSSRHYLLQPGLTTHAQYILNVPKVAHNTYLDVLAEGGVPALLMFLAILGASLRCLQKAWQAFRKSRDTEMELLCYALFAGLFGFLVASFFLSEEYSKQLWILLAFAPFLLRVASLPPAGGDLLRRSASPAPARLAEDRSGRWAAKRPAGEAARAHT